MSGILKYFRPSAVTTEEADEQAIATPTVQQTEPAISDNDTDFSDGDNTEDDDDDSSDESNQTEGDPPRPKRQALESNDIASYLGRSKSISSSIKYNLLHNHFAPAANYSFPRIANGHAFQYQWLVTFPWLRYSKIANGGFCLPCVLFANTAYRGSSPGILVSHPLIRFGSALEKLRKHAQKEYHRDAVVRAEEFIKVASNQQPSIQQQISQTIAQRIASNRQKLASIFKTVEFCGRQNVPLRGHRDNITNLEADQSRGRATNHGNFWALLHFRIEAGDALLQQHLAQCDRNATYTSSVIQNQVIDVLADQIRNQIITKVQSAIWFSVIADEVTDSSNKEQLTLVVRYVDTTDTQLIREDFVGFFECDSGITGNDLADKITSSLQSFGLDLEYLRGQGYDGAGNMAGSVKGAAARITANYPLALYFHCASHCLNLAVVKSLELTAVRNMIGIVDKAYVFFKAHPKRQRALEQAIQDTQPESKKHKLKDLCRTRWVQRIDSIEVFCSLHRSTVACMEKICEDGPKLWSSDSLTDAGGLQLAITSSDFLSALVITKHCLKHIKALTTSLQGESKDVVAAVEEINNVITTLQNTRDNILTHHCEWFSEVEEMAEAVNVQLSLPRRCGRQKHRSNVPADTPSEYYRRTISIPIFDHLLTEMNSRFDSHQQAALIGFNLVPSQVVTLPNEDRYVSTIKGIGELYQNDLPSFSSLDSELRCWYVKWTRHSTEHGIGSLPSTSLAALRHATSMYPNIRVLLSILSTLPVTSCTAERSFSGLKRVKALSRSSMTTPRLTGLSLLCIHQDIPIDISAAIDEFCRRHPRRMELQNLLQD